VVELVHPQDRYEVSYSDAMAEFYLELRGVPPTAKQLAEFVALTRAMDRNAAGVELPEDRVPGSTFWLVEGEVYLGRVDIRHWLTDDLRRDGGHVGYSIRPSARRNGYGRLSLKLALVECCALGMDRVLVTCDITNEASRRIIEANGGILEDVIGVEGREASTMRFWIDIPVVGAAPEGPSSFAGAARSPTWRLDQRLDGRG
jgi:predicted acetyltransferase